MDTVKKYLNKVLIPRLRKYGVCEPFISNIANIVEMQIMSLLRHWNDLAFRKTVLLLGMEEGSFYQPPAKTEVRAFVVAAIRNSPIETLQSAGFAAAGLSAELTDADVKAMTSDAVTYFAKQDFVQLCNQITVLSTYDIYEHIKATHPVSWTALEQLAVMTSKVKDFPRVGCSAPFSLDEILPSGALNNIPTALEDVLDGYERALGRRLTDILTYLIGSENNSCFVIDSFKFLTRNVEKLFDVFEFLLTRDIAVATTNFYISNGHVEKRAKLLRAAHSTEEYINNLSQTTGLGYKHKAALNASLKQIYAQE